MRTIKNITTPDNDIICTQNCPNKDECANHESAGGSRTETGARPQIYLYRGITIYCNEKFYEDWYGAVTMQQLEDNNG